MNAKNSCTKIELIDLDSVKINDENPRKISELNLEKLIDSILVFPKMMEIRPIVVDKNMVVLGGNMRLRAFYSISSMSIGDIESRISDAGDEQKEDLMSFWSLWLTRKQVPVIKSDLLTEEEKRQFIIKDNVGFGEWDWGALTGWDKNDLQDWGLELPDEWDDSDAANSCVEEDDFTEEDAGKAESRVKLGEIYQLGKHRLMCGDSTDADSVVLLMNGDKADMVFTDPPYGMKKEGEGVLNDNLNRDDLNKFNSRWISISICSLKDNGSWYCWGIDEILMDIYADILRPMIYDRKLSFRNLITWDKGSAQGQTSEGFKLYPIADEKCLFVVRGAATLSSGVFRTKEYFFEGFSGIRDYLRGELEKSGLSMKEVIGMTSTYATHYFALSQWAFPTEKDYNIIRDHCKGAAFQKEYAAFQKEYAELQKEYAELQKEYAELLPYFDNTHDNMNNVWHFERARYTDNDSRTNDVHATPKPIALCSRAIKSSSRECEIVLDLFGGSGSTLIASEQLNRKCYMMELSPHYCDVIIARWEKLTGKEAVKVYG